MKEHQAVIAPSAGKTTVLVVDDAVGHRRGLARFLKSIGYRVLTSSTGTQAVRKAADPGVAIVLLDIRLPGKLDGIQAARMIQEQWPKKEVVFVSAFAHVAEYQERIKMLSLRAGLLEKPSTESKLNDLVATIRSLEDRTKRPAGEVDTNLVKIDEIDLALYRALERHPDLLRTLDWRVFEKLLADILDTFGYKVELTRGTKDGGVDIFAFRSSHQWGDEMYILQAKRWSNRVGIEPVQRLLFLHNSTRATKSCLATTSTFTRGAWELANQYQWQLSLRDYEALREWIKDALGRKLHRSPNPGAAPDD